MTVALTVSETINGGDFDDVLEPGGLNYGCNLGPCTNGVYCPLVGDPADNDGEQDIFISHDAADDPITDVKTYIGEYTLTGNTYGGARDSATDKSLILGYGLADTGATKNNTDGLSGGIHIDMGWNAATIDQFTPTRAQVEVYGKAGAGIDLASAIDMHVDAMSYWNAIVEADASTPVTGQIGKSTDSVLGNRAHLKMRFYLPASAIEGGYMQFAWIVAYSFTS